MAEETGDGDFDREVEIAFAESFAKSGLRRLAAYDMGAARKVVEESLGSPGAAAGPKTINVLLTNFVAAHAKLDADRQERREKAHAAIRTITAYESLNLGTRAAIHDVIATVNGGDATPGEKLKALDRMSKLLWSAPS